MVPIASIFHSVMLEESALEEFWDQWQELVTKVERIKKEGEEW